MQKLLNSYPYLSFWVKIHIIKKMQKARMVMT